MKNHTPQIIQFDSFGSDTEGFLDVASYQRGIPFDIKRTFWVYKTPTHITRGRHAHHETEMILIALNGFIEVHTETNNVKEIFTIDSPEQGLFLPKMCWHEMKYSQDAIQLVLASTYYEVEDYIRDYQQFQSLTKTHVED